MTAMLKPKHQRLVLVVIALAAVLVAGVLAAWALRNEASYYYVPSELLAAHPSPDKPGRLGGLVEKGSIKTAPDGVTIDFVVTDGSKSVPVRFRGIVPDLFVEGSGVVADGHLEANGVFVADTLLAKHDENYVPRELKDMTDAEKLAAIKDTTK